MGSNPSAPARKKILAGAEGFENEPFMLKDPLKSLISSVPYDLGRPTSCARESVLKRFYTLIGIKTVVRTQTPSISMEIEITVLRQARMGL
jgi:hypothetical protein